MIYLLLEQAKKFREDARRSRELAACLSRQTDKVTLLLLAERQDAAAASLEAKAKVFAPWPKFPAAEMDA